MQNDTELKEIFKKTAAQIAKPLLQDDLEFMLIQNGLATDLKPIQIRKLMSNYGFYKKMKMVEGERARYWVSDMFKESAIAKKIRLNSFLTEYLADKTEIDFNELVKVMLENKFDYEIWSKHFYHADETYRKWNGWVLIGRLKDKTYKKVDSEDEKSA